MSNTPRRQAGFTLVEMVVAFVLLSMVLATGFEVFTAGMRRAIDLEDRAQALVVAQSHLASAGVEQGLKEGQSQGQTEDGKYRWAVSITPFAEAMQDPNQPLTSAYGLFRIEVTVQWRGADERDRTMMLSTLELGSIL